MAELKQHDTARKLTDTLRLGNAAIDLSGCTVSIIFRNRAGGSAVKRTATIVSAVNGQVEYKPIAADVQTAGEFDIEWEIVFPDATQLSVPTRDYARLTIHPDLA